MIYALLPVKDPRHAKDRLRELLAREEREELARLMFAVALGELLRARGFDRVVVASSDEQVLALAAAAGAAVLRESTQHGHSASADRAARQCKAEGATTMLFMPIDVPLVRAYEIEAVLQMALALPAPRLVIVPSADDTGTNAMVRTPPDLIESRFGPGSFNAHVEQAVRRQARVHVTRPAGLVLDLDTPDDVSQFLARSPEGAVADFLRRIGAPERLKAAPA